MQEIQNHLRIWKIQPDRIREVTARAATNYVDSDAWRADVALQLLVDATETDTNVDGHRGCPAR